MDTKEVIELKINEDIKHSVHNFVINELVSQEEINEGLQVTAGLSQQFRHVHVDLRNELGDNYEGKYPEYDKILGKMRDFTKSLRSEMRALK